MHTLFQARITQTSSDRPRFLSEGDCHDIARRLTRFSAGGGETFVNIVSAWRGSVRWARNLVSEASEVRDDHLVVNRVIDGAANDWVEINDNSDAALMAAVRRAERLAKLAEAAPGFTIFEHYEPEPCTAPSLFFEDTYQLDAEHRAATARQLARTAIDAGVLSAGYIQLSAQSQALITSYGYARYFQYTWAKYSVTVRDPKRSGSGWAGVDWPMWSKIDAPALTQIALEKCLQSRDPVAIEPGRYTTILEPQAVCDFVGKLLTGIWWPFLASASYQALDRQGNENYSYFPFSKGTPSVNTTSANAELGFSQLGERVVDERITMTSDPLDPELGFPPFEGIRLTSSMDLWTDVYHPVTWIKDGVLTNLAYDRAYAIHTLHQNTGLPRQGAFRMSGGNTAIEEMIATTERGILVTRFDRVTTLGSGEGKASLRCHGATRDGVWLIERGRISQAVRNMVFTESILFTLNNVEQLGTPQRVFHPAGDDWWTMPQPAVVPPLKVRDFSFTALTSAI